MASLRGLNRTLLRLGGAATATTLLTTVAVDQTAARVSTQATTAAGRFGRQQIQRCCSITTTMMEAAKSSIVTTTTATTTMMTSPSTFCQSMLKSSRRNSQPRSFSTSSAPSNGFVQWYEGHLEARPVLTKMVTGCLLWSIGDAVAQLVPQVASSENTGKPIKYDIERTGRAALFGFAVHAPTSHVHFNFLEWMTVKGGYTGLYIPVFKTIMEQVRRGIHKKNKIALVPRLSVRTQHAYHNRWNDSRMIMLYLHLSMPVLTKNCAVSRRLFVCRIALKFVYWSWISNSMYHAFMGYAQGMNTSEVVQRIDDVLMDTQKAQWAFWIPVQLLNFQFVPVRHQLNVVLVTSIVWTALLSAWYPPVEEKVMEKIDAEVV
jgi:hypothetical protein